MQQIQPPSAELNSLIALYNGARYAEVENRTRTLLSEYPDDGFLWNLLGASLQLQGKDALAAFRKTAQLLPGDAESHYNLGFILGKSGRLAEAEQSYRRALEIKPDHANAHNNLGFILQVQSRFGEAEASFRRALEIMPGFVSTWYNLGVVLGKQGRFSEAEASYRRALTLKPDYAEAHNNLGFVLGKSDCLAEAEASYRRAFTLKPDYAEAHNNLGTTLEKLGRHAEAEASYRRALEINPESEHYCLALTECLLILDRAEDALLVISNAVEKKGLDSIIANNLLQLALRITQNVRPSFQTEHELLAWFSAGHHMDLEAKLRLLLDQYPKWWEGWDILCTTLQVLGKDCGEALEHALQLMPDNPDNYSQRKIFCIGANKTGTTSIENVFESLGLLRGNQAKAEMLIHDWGRQDYRRLIRYCQTAEAFQDAPFSMPGTFKALDRAFPNSKFILTIRNNADVWYDSLVNFHTKLLGKGRIPTTDDLRQFDYLYPGFVFDALELVYGANEASPYNRKPYIQIYNDHNDRVKEYFNGRPEDLLVLNIAEPDAMEHLLNFLGYPYTGQTMPHFNSSKG